MQPAGVLPTIGSRPLRLAFVLDPLPELKAWKDSSVAMMRAAQHRGHKVSAIEAQTLAWRRPEGDPAGGVSGLARHLHLSLDEAARLAIARCQFIAATQQGQPVEQWVTIRYVWKL